MGSLDDVGGRGSDVQLTGRPWQVKQTLDAVLTDPRLQGSIDANRIGMIGYSAGGYTTLTTIGGRHYYALWGAHCKEHPEDDELCPVDGSWVPPRITRPGWELPPPDPHIKAAVVMAPAGILFDAKGLSGITIPLQIYRARDDHFVRNDWNADHVASLLSNDPKVTSLPGEAKERFYRLVCERLAQDCGISPSDVVISPVENGDEDWSFGLGRAQFLTGEL